MLAAVKGADSAVGDAHFVIDIVPGETGLIEADLVTRSTSAVAKVGEGTVEARTRGECNVLMASDDDPWHDVIADRVGW